MKPKDRLMSRTEWIVMPLAVVTLSLVLVVVDDLPASGAFLFGATVFFGYVIWSWALRRLEEQRR